jgi:hypothetical protein
LPNPPPLFITEGAALPSFLSAVLSVALFPLSTYSILSAGTVIFYSTQRGQRTVLSFIDKQESHRIIGTPHV